MATIATVRRLTGELESATEPEATRRAGDALARAIVEARAELVRLGAEATAEPALAAGRDALDRAQERAAVRWDTRPAVADVVQLVRAAGMGQDSAVRLLGGHP